MDPSGGPHERRNQGAYAGGFGVRSRLDIDNNYGIFTTFGVGDPVRRRAIVIFTNGGGGPGMYIRIVRAASGYDMLAFMR